MLCWAFQLTSSRLPQRVVRAHLWLLALESLHTLCCKAKRLLHEPHPFHL